MNLPVLNQQESSFKAVIFDFGGVLCFPPGEDRFAAAAKLIGLDTATFVQAFWKDRIEYDRGQDARAYWNPIAQLAGRELTEQLLAEMVQLEIAFWSRFDDRLLTWTNTLRRAGLRTGILSNLPRHLGEHLRATPGFLEHFDQVTFSYELGLVKPDAGIYRHAIEGLTINPQDALFLDDREENVEGALAVGLPAYLYSTWENFLAENRARYRLPPPTA